MTIEREEAGVLIAVCDGCGERRLLDLEPEKEDGEAGEGELAEALEAIGWRRDKPERHRFGSSGLGIGYRETYHHDLCDDCQSGDEGPQPRFGSGRVARQATVGAFENDPCDDWPRALVFKSVGLRPDCGHPPADPPGRCAYCDAGYAIGWTTPSWRRNA